MKNLLRLFVFALFISFVSCTSNDDGDVTVGLEGTWKMTSFDVGAAYDLNNDGSASSDLIIETGCYQNETLDFNGDNSGVATNRSFLDIEVIAVSGSNDVTYEFDCVPELFTQNFTWAQNNSTVLITIDNFFLQATQNENTLTLTIPQGFSIEVPDGNGALITLTENVTVVYTKQ